MGQFYVFWRKLSQPSSEGVNVSETKRFLESIVEHVEDDAGNMVFVSFGESLKPQLWAMPPSRVSEMGLKLCTDWNSETGRNVYWSAGLRRRDLSPAQRGGAADVTAMLAIVVDLDDAEASAAWEAKVAACPGLQPSAVVRTSFTPTPRYQLIYLLHEPTSDFEHWRRAARSVEAYFGADHCSKDLAHVWRVPGTTNYPNARKASQGRITEASVLVHFHEARRFDLSDFTDNLPEPEPEVEVPEINGGLSGLELSFPWETYNEIMGCLPEWMQMKLMEDVPPSDRSTFDWQVAKECARAGLKMGDLLALYGLAPQEPFASKWREKEMNRPNSGNEYLARTYVKARVAAEKEGPLPEKPDTEWLNHVYPYNDEEELPAEIQAELARLRREERELWAKGGEVEAPAEAQADWSQYVLTANDIDEKEEEDVPYLIHPWLQQEAIHCVHGPTGGGKSYFVAHQLYGLAIGKGAGPFDVTRPARVLYIDGEMGKRTLRKRLRDLKRSYGPDHNGNFIIWSPYFFPKGMDIDVNILEPEQQQRFTLMARNHKADVIVFDNVRTCARGMVENDADSWEKLNEYWRKLRQLGLTVVWVHHNKKPQQGSSDPEGSYSGSTNAMTVVEVQVPVLPVAVSKVEEWSERRRKASGGRKSISHGITVDLAHAKNRERDLAIHKKITLAYERDEQTGKVQLVGFDEKRSDDDKTANLSKRQWAWGYYTGIIGGRPLTKAEISKELKIPEGSVHYYFTAVEQNKAEQDEVRDLFPPS